MKTKLQQSMQITDLARAPNAIFNVMHLSHNVDLETMLREGISNASIDDPFVVVDLCCGQGFAAEYLAAYPEYVFIPKHDPPNPLEAHKLINITGIDQNVLNHDINRTEIEFLRGKRHDFVREHILELVASGELKTGGMPHHDYIAKRVKEELASHPKDFYANFINADATAIPLQDNSVDLVYSIAGFVYIPDVLKALEEVYRILKPGGKAVIEICHGKRGICVSPNFDYVLQETDGSDIFSVHPITEKAKAKALRKVIYPDSCVIMINKSEQDIFQGFPFEFNRKYKLLRKKPYHLGYGRPVAGFEHNYYSGLYQRK